MPLLCLNIAHVIGIDPSDPSRHLDLRKTMAALRATFLELKSKCLSGSDRSILMLSSCVEAEPGHEIPLLIAPCAGFVSVVGGQDPRWGRKNVMVFNFSKDAVL